MHKAKYCQASTPLNRTAIVAIRTAKFKRDTRRMPDAVQERLAG